MKVIATILFSTVFAISLSSCSDDNSSKTAGQKFDHEHGGEATDLVKHKFEHDFAKQCVEREVQNSINKDVDRERFTGPCLCIATYMMQDLTAKEAEKFLNERKNTQSLRIRFENAAYNCLQKSKEQQDDKTPVIFNQR